MPILMNENIINLLEIGFFYMRVIEYINNDKPVLKSVYKKVLTVNGFSLSYHNHLRDSGFFFLHFLYLLLLCICICSQDCYLQIK